MGAFPLPLLAASALLLAGCEGGEGSEEVLSAGAMGGMDLPSVEVGADQLAAAPRYRLSVDPDLEIDSEGPDSATWLADVRAMATLGDGALAVLTHQGASLRLLAADGSRIGRLDFPQGRIAHRMSVAPDGVIVLSLRPHMEMRVARNATLRDSVSIIGSVIGVLADGRRVSKDVARRRPGDSGVERYYCWEVGEAWEVGDAAEPRRPVFLGRTAESPIVNGLSIGPVPWAPHTEAVVTDDATWVSPLGGPELVAIGCDGRALRRIRWEEPGANVTDEELRAWRESRIRNIEANPRFGRTERSSLVNAVEAYVPGTEAVVVQSTMAGRDGSIWVQKRARWRTEGDRTWLGFTTDGRVVGTLTVARELTPLEFGEGYVWVGPPTSEPWPRGFIRRYRLVREQAR